MQRRQGMGWLRDLPDIRDFEPHSTKGNTPTRSADQVAVASWFQSSKATSKGAPPEANLVKWFTPIENQGDLGSCTAHAGVALLEYFENRAFGNYLDASRLFLYKVTRNLMGACGDTGANLRTTMKAMALFGIVPEASFPYDVTNFDAEPTPFAYAYAANYRSMSYFRLDQGGMHPHDIVEKVKSFIAAGYPSMFGFSVYNKGNGKGELGFPATTDTMIGGHAVVAMGFDDTRVIGSCKGAFRIRNSWGDDWGDSGYGWLPYEYVLKGLAADFWSLFKAQYINTNQFE